MQHGLSEFDNLQINQVLKHCENIFTLNDLFKFVEIWRYRHAKEILRIFYEVFGDVDIAFSDDDEEEFEDMEIVHDDWNDLQDTASSPISVSSTIMDEHMDETIEDSDMSGVHFENESDLIV